jgi:hypothetical protein
MDMQKGSIATSGFVKRVLGLLEVKILHLTPSTI